MSYINEYAVPYKMKAADYHLKRMRRLFELGLVVGPAMEQLKGRKRAIAQTRHDAFFWEFESFLFQLYSAFDLVLQELALRRGLAVAPEDVNWGEMAKMLPQDAVLDHLKSVRRRDWFVRLRESRHEITHRRPPVFACVQAGGRVIAMCLGWLDVAPGGVGGPEALKTCDGWWLKARDALIEALRLMRETAPEPGTASP